MHIIHIRPNLASFVIVAVGCMHAADMHACLVNAAAGGCPCYVVHTDSTTSHPFIKTPRSMQCRENIVHHTFLCCRRVSHYLLENGGDGQMTPLLRLGSGACAGIIGMTATYPLDMVRGRLTVQAGKEYTGILHATRMIVKQVPSVRHTYDTHMSS